LYALLISPMHARCYAQLILLDLITLIILIYGEVYKLKSSSLCSLFQPPATPFLLGPNMLISSLFSDTIYAPPFVWETKCHTHTKKKVTLQFIYFALSF
jgi:hypothetical protein